MLILSFFSPDRQLKIGQGNMTFFTAAWQLKIDIHIIRVVFRNAIISLGCFTFICDCYHCMSLPAVGWSAVCDCGISWSCSLFE